MSQEFYDAAVFAELAKLKSMYKARPAVLHSVDKYGFTALHGVVGEDHLEVAQWLIHQGLSPDVKNDMGIAPLHLAANPEMVELLCQSGADINIRSNDGSTPLIIHANEPDTEDVLEILLVLGANINLKDAKGRTAMDFARMRGDDEKIELLKAYGGK